MRVLETTTNHGGRNARGDGIAHVAAIFVLLLGLSLGATSHAQSSLTYLEVRPPQAAISASMETPLEVVLLDAFFEPISASRDYRIRIEVVDGRRNFENFVPLVSVEAELESGSTVVIVPLAFPRAGVFKVRAVHPDLVSRETVMRVGRPAGLVPGPLDGLIHAGAGLMQVALAQPLEGEAPEYVIEVFYSEPLPLLANGGQAADIRLFLSDPQGNLIEAEEDIHVRLIATHGTLQPDPIVIPAGASETTVMLHADTPGVATLRFLGSNPPADIRAFTEDPPPIEFSPQVIRLVPSPPTTSLLEPTELVVRLYDTSGNALTASEDTLVAVTLDQGRGILRPTSIKIASGSFEGRGQFLPAWSGQVMVSAASAGLSEARTTIEVALALSLTLLGLTALGGGSGAFIALTIDRSTQVSWPSRLVVGMLTGFILYWGITFGFLDFDAVRTALTNPVGAFAISLLGGYAGAEVLAPLLARLGIRTSSATET